VRPGQGGPRLLIGLAGRSRERQAVKVIHLAKVPNYEFSIGQRYPSAQTVSEMELRCGARPERGVEVVAAWDDPRMCARCLELHRALPAVVGNAPDRRSRPVLVDGRS